MIGTRAGRAPKTLAVFSQKCFAKSPQTRVADRPTPFADVIPIGRLFRAQLRRALQKLGPLLRSEMAHLPFFRIEPELLMLLKLPAQLDKIRGLQQLARFEFRMIAPDPQRHPVGGVRETQLTIRLLLPRDLCRSALHLHVHARFDCTVLRGAPTGFYQG